MRVRCSLVALTALFVSPPDALTVSGRITTPRGDAVPGAIVSVKRDGGTVTVSVYADASGQYSIGDLPDGAYTLRAAAAGFAPVSQPLRGTSADLTLEPVADVWETAPSSRLLSLLPDGETKRKFILDCTGCHQFDRQTVLSAANGGLKTQSEWRVRTEQMIQFAGGASGFPIMSPSRDADSTAAWLVRNLGTARPVLPPTESAGSASSAESVRITEYDLPSPTDLPHDLIVAPDGNVVITGMFTHRMYLLDPASGVMRTEPIPVQGANPRALEIGPDGTWWVLLGGPHRIARRTPDGAWSTWDVGMYGHSIGLGADGRVWTNGHFTKTPEVWASLDPATGAVSRHDVPAPPMDDGGSTIPYELRVAPDGAIWVTQLAGGRLVRFDPAANRFQLFPMPAPFSGPRRIDVDSQGRVWIPEYARNRLSRFDPPTERFSEWELPVPDALPYVVRLDQQRNALWIGTGAADVLFRFDLQTERFTAYPLPTSGSLIRHMDIDRRTGNVWLAPGASPGRAPSRVVRVQVG